MSHTLRRIAVGALCAAASAAAFVTSATPASASVNCYALGGGKTNCYVWPRYGAPTMQGPGNYLTVGGIPQGWNYVFCQKTGTSRTEYGYTNYWWLKTDDNAGHKGVYVNAIYISSGANNSPVPGVPIC